MTRSNTGIDDLFALPDEEEPEEAEDDDGDVTVEICDESGAVVESGGQELAQAEGWEDEDTGAEAERDNLSHDRATTADDADRSSQTETEDLNALQQQEAIVSHQDAYALLATGNNVERSFDEDILAAEDTIAEAEDATTPGMRLEISSEEREVSEPFRFKPIHDVPLPEGFVSPAKRGVTQPRPSKASLDSRRRTLPIQFAPTLPRDAPEIASQSGTLIPTVLHDKSDMNESVAQDSTLVVDVAPERIPSEVTEEDEWEDIEVESPVAKDDRDRMLLDSHVDGDSVLDDETLPEKNTAVAGEDTNTSNAIENAVVHNGVAPLQDAHTSTKISSSPIPTIEGQHPRLPLRRSPRRKSSSPLKKSTILPSTQESHLIAFTPIKGLATFTSSGSLTELGKPVSEHDDRPLPPSSPLERAASAPPEEPQMSPQKPAKPRVSDDTALLQAFLNRAAESKNSRRVSATKRESISNRRDSDTIRHALASPAKADVLGDLDPNSPTPRKGSTQPNARDVIGFQSGDRTTSTVSEDEPLDDSKPAANTRRSGRSAKKAQPATQAVPNRIAIRGNTDNVVLKRTEAQELALVTRNNTRKNKGGAVLPPLRLMKIPSQLSSTSNEMEGVLEDELPIVKAEGARSVQWAETLVQFFEGAEISEVSVLSDELNDPTQCAGLDQLVQMEDDASSTAPPPSETPSKPKIRRLRAPRTAATPRKAPSASVQAAISTATAEKGKEKASEDSAGQQANSKPPTRRRSRIATPAKGLGGTTLLATESDQPAPPVFNAAPLENKSATAKSSTTKRRATQASRLPAPGSALGQGKENLISSPPKKMSASSGGGGVVPSTKNFAPKLDFGPKHQLGENTEQSVPGLTSPAKKSGRGKAGVVFGTAAELGKESFADMAPPGLSSPAKKRTRRAV